MPMPMVRPQLSRSSGATPPAGPHKRIYDQVFLDGPYTAGGCLIVAATIDHVIAWHWCKHETTRDYQLLLERIEAPLIAVIDGVASFSVV